MSSTLVSVVSFAVVLAPLVARAQSHESPGIRAQGMAGAFVAVADDATATWWNPAGLATGAYFNALIEIDKGGGRAFALAFPALGLSYYRLRISEIRPSGSTAEGPSGRQDQGAAGTGLPSSDLVDVHQFGVTAGESLGSHLVVASTLKFVRARSETQGDLDMGAMAVFGGLRFGVSVRNLRASEFGEGTSSFRLPRRGRAGVALMTPARGVVNQVTVGFDFDLNQTIVVGRQARFVAAGGELWVLGKRLGLRAGIGTNTVDAGGSFVAGGASIALRSGFYVDWAATGGSDQAAHRWGAELRVTF
jgi:hypothetical protein